MERSLKWRTLALIGSVVLCVGMLAPSFFPEEAAVLVPLEKKINLGLDLQGGLHIVYCIDLDRGGRRQGVRDQARPRGAVRRREDQGRRSRRRVAARRRDGPRSRTRPRRSRSRRDQERLRQGHHRARLRRDRWPANSICFRVSSEFADSIKKSALDQRGHHDPRAHRREGHRRADRGREGRRDPRRAPRPRQGHDPGDARHHRAHREARVQGRRRRLRVHAQAVRARSAARARKAMPTDLAAIDDDIRPRSISGAPRTAAACTPTTTSSRTIASRRSRSTRRRRSDCLNSATTTSSSRTARSSATSPAVA